MNPVRIDLHHHMLTPEYVEALAAAGIVAFAEMPFPAWTPDHSLAMLDRTGDAAASLPPRDELREAVQLLPHFDCYMIGCHPRERLVPAEWTKRVLTRGAAGTLPVVIVAGVVAGIRQQRRSGRRIEIRVEAFRPLSTQQHHALKAAVAHIGAILEANSLLSLGAIDARPHL